MPASTPEWMYAALTPSAAVVGRTCGSSTPKVNGGVAPV